MATRFLKSLNLDASPDRLDLRDRPYVPPIVSLPPRWPPDQDLGEYLLRYVADGLILDQGSEGACTGFGLACVVNFLLWRRQISRLGASFETVSARMLYHLARFYDEWPGEDYSGSSCRGALKAWHKHGVCTDRLWPYRGKQGKPEFVEPAEGWDKDAATRPLGVYYRIDKASAVDMQSAIREIGAIYCSCQVDDGWDPGRLEGGRLDHEGLPVIARCQPSKDAGLHAFAVVGYNERGFVVQNSWGPAWGASGFAVLPYDDWLEAGTDAWVCALGVPVTGGVARSCFVKSGHRSAVQGPAGLAASAAALSAPSRRSVTPWPVDEAYRHTVVMGNNGMPINRLVTAENAVQSLQRIALVEPGEWFSRANPSAPRKLFLYVHGGLNAEPDALARVCRLAPYFQANGVYPLFIAWKTGLAETVGNIIEDELAKALSLTEGVADFLRDLRIRAGEALDRRIEVICEATAVKSLWSQMKQNARDAAMKGRVCALLADAFSTLRSHHPDMEIHLAAHSAGSIVIGHLLTSFGKKIPVASCTLFAPACATGFACTHYAGAVERGILDRSHFHIHVLSDRRELEDRVGPYGKSLLYLVSRALEDRYKTPLLGLEKTFRSGLNPSETWNEASLPDVLRWQAFWKGNDSNLHVTDAPQVNNGIRMIPTSHGSFDNDVDAMEALIRRVRGTRLIQKVDRLDD